MPRWGSVFKVSLGRGMINHLHIGIDIGGTKSAVILGDQTGAVRQRRQWPTAQTPGPAALIDCAVRIIGELRQSATIKSVGVSIGGPLDSSNGIIYSPPNLPGWDAVPLKSMLESALGLPVMVMHDAAACALAEQRWACPQATRLAYLTCGTGLGVGLVFDGKPYIGAAGRSPEIGHVRWRDDGPQAFGKRGSVEAYGSGSGLAGLAQYLFPIRWPNGCDGPQLATLAEGGDGDATAVIQTNARTIGGVCALLADTLALDRIVLGSLARYLGEPWLKEVRSVFAREVLESVLQSCPIEPSILGDRLQDCSSLAAALPAQGAGC